MEKHSFLMKKNWRWPLEMALSYGLIDKETFDFAYRVAREILEKLKRKEFPPKIVWEYGLEGLT